ncbi:nucleotidyltransferase family protein [Paraherbaspirillum soli]|uniref:NTP transferase domain-containing protein n=1 Tax=Paraherbaspirillum soli TaxID=631222 RepID=A0ABW0ME09_9BURK
MSKQYAGQIVGVLLAAGRGRRFDPSGARSKLLQQLPHDVGGLTVLARAAGNLAAAVPICVVLRPDAPELAAQVAGYDQIQCDNADDGMAASLVCALQQTETASGWVIALGDMPYVQTATVQALVTALRQGADIAVPMYGGRRGNPVAFSRQHLPQLLQLQGDQGARSLLRSCLVREVAVPDPGIHQDIDTAADILRS